MLGSAPSFQEWHRACTKLPLYKNASRTFSHSVIRGFTHRDFEKTLDAFSHMMAQSSLSNNNAWFASDGAPDASFFDLNVNVNKEILRHPYVQKHMCAQGSTFIVHGDLHGDIQSLVTSLAPYMAESSGFKLKPGINAIFLGDYVDKGLYGCECIYTLMRLKLDNPDRVFLLRGNHETREISSAYGFLYELQQKGFSNAIINKTFRLYNLLPVALYLGSHNAFVQCCHGGLEVGFNAGPLLNAPAQQQFQWINDRSCTRKAIADSVGISACCNHNYLENNNPGDETGFMWSDFVVDKQQPTFFRPERVSFNFSYKTTQQLLQLTNQHGPNTLCGILRAHQHTVQLDPMMRMLLDYYNQDPANKGIAKLWTDNTIKGNRLWHGIVVTFNVSPNTPYGVPFGMWPGFNFDTIGTLTINGPFEQWTLDVTRKTI